MDTRWNPHLKASVLDGIARGSITRDHAMKCYNISTEEMAEWEGRYDRGGIKGLRVTQINDAGRVHRNILNRREVIQTELNQIDEFLSSCRRYAKMKFPVNAKRIE